VRVGWVLAELVIIAALRGEWPGELRADFTLLVVPSTDMLAILGRERPCLGRLLISASSGGIHVDRPFTVVNPTACLSAYSSPVFVRTFNWRLSFAAIGFLEYGIAFAAVANNISQRPVITWSCPNWGWVIGWSALPAAVYLVTQFIFTFTVKIERPENHSPAQPESYGTGQEASSGKGSSNLPPTDLLPQYSPREGHWCYLAQTITPILAYCHLFFGIAIFGSILFVPFGDALPICCRYKASPGVSRLLLAFEFDTWKARKGNDVSLNRGCAEIRGQMCNEGVRRITFIDDWYEGMGADLVNCV
jgi:hypothetical protein